MFPSLDRVDWNLLHQQKKELIKLLERRRLSASQAEALSGIVHLLDALQDDAAAADRWAFPGERKEGVR